MQGSRRGRGGKKKEHEQGQEETPPPLPSRSSKPKLLSGKLKGKSSSPSTPGTPNGFEDCEPDNSSPKNLSTGTGAREKSSDLESPSRTSSPARQNSAKKKSGGDAFSSLESKLSQLVTRYKDIQ